MTLQPWQRQLLNKVNASLIKDADIRMAKEEIVKRTLHPLKNLWWKFMPGTKITVEWPTGWTRPVSAAGGGYIQVESADPNDHFRPWLETNVGQQGWDWDWRLGPIIGAQGTGAGTLLIGDYLVIKFRKGREKYATMFELLFN